MTANWQVPHPRCELFFDMGGLGWVDLDELGMVLEGFSYRRGRQDRLGRFEPGRATLVFSDPDNLLPTNADAALIPLRILVDWREADGTTHNDIPLWFGYLDEGVKPTSVSNAPARLVTITATDFLGDANNTTMPDSQWAYWIASESPDAWWRGWQSPVTEVFEFIGGTNPLEPVAGTPDDGDPIPMNSLVPSVFLENNGDRVGSDTFVGTGDDEPWAVALAFRMEDSSAAAADRWLAVGRTTSVSGALRWGIRISQASGEIAAEIRDSGDTVIGTAATSTPGTRYDDGEPHVILARFNINVGGNDIIRIHTDQDNQSDSGTLSGTPRGSGGFIVTGSTSASQFPVEISELAYWGRDVALPDPVALSPVLAVFVDNETPSLHPDVFGLWYGQDTSDRLDSLLATAGKTVTTEIHHTADFFWLGLLPHSTLGEHISLLGETFLGAAYVLRDGTLRIRDVDALTDGANAADYATIQAYISDDPAEAGTPWVEFSSRKDPERRIDRVINQVHISRAEGYSVLGDTVHSFDVASRDEWGVRPLELGSEAFFNTGLQDTADLLIVPDPPLEVGQIEIRPWGDDVATEFVLLNAELEKAIHYHESTFTLDEIIDADYRIIAEEMDWSGTDDWSYRMTIAPL